MKSLAIVSELLNAFKRKTACQYYQKFNFECSLLNYHFIMKKNTIHSIKHKEFNPLRHRGSVCRETTISLFTLRHRSLQDYQSNLSRSSLPTFTCAGSKRHTLHGKPSQLTTTWGKGVHTINCRFPLDDYSSATSKPFSISLIGKVTSNVFWPSQHACSADQDGEPIFAIYPWLANLWGTWQLDYQELDIPAQPSLPGEILQTHRKVWKHGSPMHQRKP